MDQKNKLIIQVLISKDIHKYQLGLALLEIMVITPPCQSRMWDYQWLSQPNGYSSHSYSSVNASIWQEVGVPTPKPFIHIWEGEDVSLIHMSVVYDNGAGSIRYIAGFDGVQLQVIFTIFTHILVGLKLIQVEIIHSRVGQ